MKVKIGKYLNYWGPYQIADLLKYFKVSEDRCDCYGDRLASIPYLSEICNWIHEHRKRKIKVHIDYYDVWSVDHTLALIILPSLKKLKEIQHGAPFVDSKDTPTYPSSENTDIFNMDEHWFDRWNWVLGEMIFAFEELVKDDIIDSDIEDRVNNGLRLFGKYYRGLWD